MGGRNTYVYIVPNGITYNVALQVNGVNNLSNHLKTGNRVQ